MPQIAYRPRSAFDTLGVGGVASILWRYFREKAIEQIRSVWFIILYLVAFQTLVLKLPVVFSLTITFGIAIVVVGLTFFMEGLRLGLMPFGETIGAILPRNSRLPLIITFSFLLGVGATLAEPAISILKKAGAGVSPENAPLLFSLLNDFSGQLVAAVGIGVGVAVPLGILRFFFGWSLKVIILPLVTVLIGLTLFATFDPILNPVIGLAWDCGAVTTGPVTVPLVLALGIGVCRIIGHDDSAGAGFGIVTLASLFPVLAVLGLALFHHQAEDYYGARAYTGSVIKEATVIPIVPVPVPDAPVIEEPKPRFTQEEFEAYRRTGDLPPGTDRFRTRYRGGEVTLEDGRIIHRQAEIVFERQDEKGTLKGFFIQQVRNPWDPDLRFGQEMFASLLMAAQAILPLCAFFFLTLLIVLREKLRKGDEIAIGVLFAVVGLALFGLGLTLGLTPLGTQLGSNIPATFASVVPWGQSTAVAPLFDNPVVGKLVTVLFAFFLGYGATLAEPALNALGQTVENATVGVVSKRLLIQVVAVGVGFGIAAGVAQMAFSGLSLTVLIIPPYILLLFLTAISSDEFVNFAWDSAGVTTGPITVPLVLAMGLGIGANIPGIADGFGILGLASVGPIITVLVVGLIVSRSRRAGINKAQDEVV